MRFRGLSVRLPIAVAVFGMAVSGCGKVKDALKEFGGIAQLSKDEITQMKQETGWDDAKMAKYKVLAGFELTDKFPGDLSQKVELGPIPLEVPSQAQGAASGKAISYSILKKQEFQEGDTKIARFEIVSVARYDFESQTLKIDGDEIGAFLDPADRVSKANGQAGKYLIVRGEGTGGLAYINGNVTLKKNDGTEALVGGARVYTTESPFVARSGSTTGKFLLAVLAQESGECKQGGFIIASKSDIATALAATGTPGSTQVELPCLGVLDDYPEYKAKYSEKATALGQASKAEELYQKANNVVTNFLGAWKLGTANPVFVQPPAPPATPVTPPADPVPAPTPQNPPVVPGPGTVDTPSTDPSITRGLVNDPQYNLGCAYSGIDDTTGLPHSLIANPQLFDDYTNGRGWRFFGDVRITNEHAALIFGNAADNRTVNSAVDDVDGYCLLTTGNQLFTKNPTATFYAPKDGKVSEMWQKVKIPENATGIQVRVAFFSQEYPTYVGSQFNDSFYMLFDESPIMIAKGNLNDLAGANDPALAAQVAACKDKASLGLAESYPCGEWDNITVGNTLHGKLWDVESSQEGPAQAPTFNCGATGATNSGKCYPGMIKPRVICRALDPAYETPGKTLTLRIGVTDIGDTFYDSALAVDSIVFTTAADPCGTTFSRDPASQVTRNPAG